MNSGLDLVPSKETDNLSDDSDTDFDRGRTSLLYHFLYLMSFTWQFFLPSDLQGNFSKFHNSDKNISLMVAQFYISDNIGPYSPNRQLDTAIRRNKTLFWAAFSAARGKLFDFAWLTMQFSVVFTHEISYCEVIL